MAVSGPARTSTRVNALPLSVANFCFVLAVVTDPEDPRFDLEKLIAKWETS